jgi:hypothetical protein
MRTSTLALACLTVAACGGRTPPPADPTPSTTTTPSSASGPSTGDTGDTGGGGGTTTPVQSTGATGTGLAGRTGDTSSASTGDTGHTSGTGDTGASELLVQPPPWSPCGDAVWTRLEQGDGIEFLHTMKVLPDGAMAVLAGSRSDELYFDEGGAELVEWTDVDHDWLAIWEADGTLRRRVAVTGAQSVSDIAVADDGVLLTLNVSESVDIDVFGPAPTHLPAGDGRSWQLVRLDLAGDLRWTARADGAGDDWASAHVAATGDLIVGGTVPDPGSFVLAPERPSALSLSNVVPDAVAVVSGWTADGDPSWAVQLPHCLVLHNLAAAPDGDVVYTCQPVDGAVIAGVVSVVGDRVVGRLSGVDGSELWAAHIDRGYDGTRLMHLAVDDEGISLLPGDVAEVVVTAPDGSVEASSWGNDTLGEIVFSHDGTVEAVRPLWTKDDGWIYVTSFQRQGGQRALGVRLDGPAVWHDGADGPVLMDVGKQSFVIRYDDDDTVCADGFGGAISARVAPLADGSAYFATQGDSVLVAAGTEEPVAFELGRVVGRLAATATALPPYDPGVIEAGCDVGWPEPTDPRPSSLQVMGDCELGEAHPMRDTGCRTECETDADCVTGQVCEPFADPAGDTAGTIMKDLCTCASPPCEPDHDPADEGGIVGWTALPAPVDSPQLLAVGAGLLWASDGVTLHSAPLDAEGLPGVWVEHGALPSSPDGLTLTASDTHLFLLGGDESDEVWSAAFDPVTGVDPWEQQGPLPETRDRASAWVVEGLLVWGGGADGKGQESQLLWAAPVEGGSVGAWVPSLLPEAVSGRGIAVNHGRLWALSEDGEVWVAPSAELPRVHSWRREIPLPYVPPGRGWGGLDSPAGYADTAVAPFCDGLIWVSRKGQVQLAPWGDEAPRVGTHIRRIDDFSGGGHGDAYVVTDLVATSETRVISVSFGSPYLYTTTRLGP